jgi:hypothetical protein
MNWASLKSVMLVLASVLLVACGSAEVGEECDDAGETDECEDDAICTNEDSGAVCRWLCDETSMCAAGHTCNGVSGSNLKSCQPDKP